MKFKPMTGQEFFKIHGQKSKDQDQRVFDVTCTEWEVEFCAQATSTKFRGQDLEKRATSSTNNAHPLIHNALNMLTHLTTITYSTIKLTYNHITQLQTETVLAFLPRYLSIISKTLLDCMFACCQCTKPL